MENIFDTNALYPGYDDLLKDYFKDYFNSVFVSFSPFFRIAEENKDAISPRSASVVSLEEFQAKNNAFKTLEPSPLRTIYSPNADYPGNEEIVNRGIPVTWQYIIDHSKLKGAPEINKALLTSIGALSKDSRKQDLETELVDFTTNKFIYHPSEGRISVIDLKRIYNCLKDNHKNEVVVTDEFFEDRRTIDITGLTSSEFALQVWKYNYIFPVDRSLLFTIDWDSFFFLICGNEELLNDIVPAYGFEGFFSNDDTFHHWAFE